MTFRNLLALIVFVAGCVEATAEQEDTVVRHFEDVTVISVARPDFVSGIIAAWAVLTAAAPNSETIEFYILYMRKEQAFPAVDARCSIDAHEEVIQRGLAADRAVDRDRPLLVPYFMECNGTVYRY